MKVSKLLSNFKQKYLTVPLAVSYWFIPISNNASVDTITGYVIFGILLSLGAWSDITHE